MLKHVNLIYNNQVSTNTHPNDMPRYSDKLKRAVLSDVERMSQVHAAERNGCTRALVQTIVKDHKYVA